ncbi:MAG: hypothetical protein A2091_02865 [Desulfuromonadales bacterium GWD2_61_12]|nr:MAG: hypothetical protein A2005_05810 [Desulfuromonadales bacterium GWC2_61_20]OGR33195.1 MAG: hypothetical protein A2091_02865 [Desulfuromonadales bacterium GWD2_61_12]HBT83216.1 hypothetical protein [Desulfuromonas sp.]
MSSFGIFILGIVVSLALVLFGCDEKTAAPTVAAPAKKSGAVAAKSVLAAKEKAEVVEPAKYVYEPGGRRDPFEPLVSDKLPPANGGKSLTNVAPEEQLTPLQQFEISQFRLIGVIIGKGKPTAMVVAPDGKAYVLQKGVKIGKNNGVVKTITSSAVSIEELYQDLSGEMLKNELEIKLPKREGA